MNFITFEQLNSCIYKNISKLPKDIDLVVGIPRSGLLVANIIGLYLNLPIADIDTFADNRLYTTGSTRKRANWITSAADAKHILVVDDSISIGDAITEAKKKMQFVNDNIKITYCVVYALATNTSMVDIYFQICNHPRMFEWNYLHHWGLEFACVDIDGILCEDPSYFENDKGNKYEHFLLNAKPKFLPTQEIGYLVTCRHEKYRVQTEEWLKKNNILYKNLIMLDENKIKTCMYNTDYGYYKGQFYKSVDCFIFLESNYEQAIQICRVSGKQVFCVNNRVLINPKNVLSHLDIVQRDFRITAKRVLKKLLNKIKT